MNELLFQQKQYAKTLMVQLQSSFQLGGMSTIVDTIFVVCVAIGLFQCFKEIGSSSLGKSIIRFGLRLWMALVLVYGGKYISQMPMLKQFTNSNAPLSITLYYKINDFANNYADKMSKNGASDEVLNFHTMNLMNTQDNMLLAITKCESAEMNCLNSYLNTGNPPEITPSEDSPVKQSEGLGSEIAKSLISKSDTLQAASETLAFFSDIYNMGIRFINNPGIILFPIMIWLLNLASGMLTVALNIVWSLIIGVSMIMLPIVTPFMIIKGFENNIKSLYKTFFSTAFFGFAVKLIMLMSNIMMEGLSETTGKFLIPKVLEMASNGAGNDQIISDIRGFLLTNFILSFAVLFIQLVGLTKVPNLSRAIMFMSIESLVNVSEVIFSGALGYAKLATKVTAMAALSVVTGGIAGAAGVATAGATKAGGFAATKGAGMLAKSGMAKSASSGMGTMMSKTSNVLGKGLSNKGSMFGKKIQSLSSNKIVNKIGRGIENSSKSVGETISQKGGDLKYKAQSLGEKAQKKLEQKSIFKKELNFNSTDSGNSLKDDIVNKIKDNVKNDDEENENQKPKNSLNKMKNSVMGRFIHRAGSKINPLEMSEKLIDSAFDITKMGAESAVKSELSGDGLDMLKYGMNTVSSIDYTGSRSPSQFNNSMTQSTIKNQKKSIDDSDQYSIVNNMLNSDKKLLDENQQKQFDLLQKNVMMGSATENDIKTYKDLAENYQLNNEQLDEYNKTKANIPELNKKDSNFDELIANYGINDERMALINNKFANKELTKNDLQNGILKTKIDEYQKNKKEQISSKIKNEYDNYFSGQKNKKELNSEYLKKTYLNKELSASFDKDTAEKLNKLIEIIKKK